MDFKEKSSSGVTPRPFQGSKPLIPAEDPVRLQRIQQETKRESQRRMIFFASAAIGLLGLGTYLANRRADAAKPPVTPEIADHLDLNELNELPAPLQAGAQAVLAGTFQLPAWRQSMDRGSGIETLSPGREAIEEASPTLHWTGDPHSANVAILSAHTVVTRAEVFKATSWTVPIELDRGAVYTWEVATLGKVNRNSFRVIDEMEESWLQELRQGNHGQSHLLMGLAFLELGMLTPAHQEFEALSKEHPQAPEAAKLLRTSEDLLKQ